MIYFETSKSHKGVSFLGRGGGGWAESMMHNLNVIISHVTRKQTSLRSDVDDSVKEPVFPHQLLCRMAWARGQPQNRRTSP